jgi:hypothetical protein
MNQSPESRHEFRVVLDGVELDAAQRERVTIAVQKAALEALSSAQVPVESSMVLGHGSLTLNPGWRGLWVLNGPAADRLGRQVQDLGFMGP